MLCYVRENAMLVMLEWGFCLGFLSFGGWQLIKATKAFADEKLTKRIKIQTRVLGKEYGPNSKQ